MKKKYIFSFLIAAAPLYVVSSYTNSYINQKPALPWTASAAKHLPPGEPGIDYTPAVVPNGHTENYNIVDGIKVFHITASDICWEVVEGLHIHAWGFNGSVPGPLIELSEGDQARFYVTNNLDSPITIHWHGILLPNGMDGVAGVTQPPIMPGQTYLYEYIFPDSGTFMYHPHFDGLTEEGMGLSGMIIVHKRERNKSKRPDRDFSIMLHEFKVFVDTARPDTLSHGFNVITMNGRVMPGTDPIVAEIGDKVWIRYGNLSAMDHHPIHLHGYSFKIIGSDGGWAPKPELLLPETTVLVPTGSAKVIAFEANNPGDWVFHCHMTHHTMNQMGDDFTDNLEAKGVRDFVESVRKLIPEYKMLGTKGMQNMSSSGLPIPENSIPMLGLQGRWGHSTTFGGMSNILRVREKTDNYKDPGPYHFPKGTRAKQATSAQIERDGIILH